MNIFFTIVAVLLALFVIWQARSIIPRLVTFFLPVRRVLYFEDEAAQPINETRQAALQPTIEKMEALGFKRLGLMVEKYPLWAGLTRELTMVSPNDHIIASLGFRRNSPSYFFYTPFDEGGVVITSHNSFRDFKREGFSTFVVASGEPAEMLESHKKTVEEFVNTGYTPYSEYTQEAVIRATNQYYDSPYPKQQLRLAGMFNLLFLVLCLFLLAVVIRVAVA
jgi:hypothetical protein